MTFQIPANPPGASGMLAARAVGRKETVNMLMLRDRHRASDWDSVRDLQQLCRPLLFNLGAFDGPRWAWEFIPKTRRLSKFSTLILRWG